MSQIAPHQQRVIDERRELADRQHKLGNFFGTPVFLALPKRERKLLAKQHGVMGEFLQILDDRIELFIEGD